MNSTIRTRGILSLFFISLVCVLSAETVEEESWESILADEAKFREMDASGYEDFEGFLAAARQRAGPLSDELKDYQSRFPDSVHLEEAFEKRLYFLRIAASGDPVRTAELEAVERRALEGPEISLFGRQEIWNSQIGRIGDLEERERMIRSFREVDMVESPRPGRSMTIAEALEGVNNPSSVKIEVAESAAEFFARHMLVIARSSEYPRSIQIADEILNMQPDESEQEVFSSLSGDWYYHHLAREFKESLDRIGDPVQLKFSALDGREVDLADFRGKVVLLDFWATWCLPCLRDTPTILSVWTALHEKGFEVIALSHDTDRAAIERYVAKNNLPWPQFFSDEGKNALLFQELGQVPLPTYWLIDQDGVLVDISAFINLEEKVQRLLQTRR